MIQIILTIIALLSLLIIATWFGYKLSKMIHSTDKNLEKEKVYGFAESIEVLKLEFEYAKTSSIQAQEDRLTLVNFYIGLFTLVISVTIGFIDKISDTYKTGIAFSFFTLSIVGFLFVLQMVRLRQAWIDSARVMNKIKEYFIDRDKEINEYLIWKTNTLPKPHKFKTLNYFSALIITLLGTSSLIAGLLILELIWLQVTLIALLYAIISIACYHFMLQYNK